MILFNFDAYFHFYVDTLQAERTSLANGERQFTSRMDRVYSTNRAVWGDRETLMEQGHLSAFVPAVVARLSASTQDKAYSFFDDLIREIRRPDARNRIPEDLLQSIEDVMVDHSRSSHLMTLVAYVVATTMHFPAWHASRAAASAYSRAPKICTSLQKQAC